MSEAQVTCASEKFRDVDWLFTDTLLEGKLISASTKYLTAL